MVPVQVVVLSAVVVSVVMVVVAPWYLVVFVGVDGTLGPRNHEFAGLLKDLRAPATSTLKRQNKWRKRGAASIQGIPTSGPEGNMCVYIYKYVYTYTDMWVYMYVYTYTQGEVDPYALLAGDMAS